MSTECGRPQGGGVLLKWMHVKNLIFCGRHKWMADGPYLERWCRRREFASRTECILGESP